jgi:hypothetical protein
MTLGDSLRPAPVTGCLIEKGFSLMVEEIVAVGIPVEKRGSEAPTYYVRRRINKTESGHRIK